MLGKIATLNIFTRIHQQMPSTLVGLTFVKDFLVAQPEKTYDFALYKDSAGKLVLAKRWSGVFKNLDYYWLRNEAGIYKGLSEADEEGAEKQKRSVSAPRYRGVVVTPRSFTLLVEFVEETAVRDDLTIRLFESIQQYLHTTGKVLPQHLKLKKRSWVYFLVAGLLNCILCCLRDPMFMREYMRGYGALLSALPQYRTSPVVFVHRDIKRENVIFSLERVYVIDFQLAVLSNHYVEAANTILHCLEKGREANVFTQELIEKYLHIDAEAPVYKAFAYYAVMYDQAISRSATTKQNRHFFEIIRDA